MNQRMAWPDIARGISIVGVVILHVGLVVPFGWETNIALANEYLIPLRMPIFFMVSGFFSAKILQYRFAELVTRRLWFLLVPYLFWTPFELWFKSLERWYGNGSPMPGRDFYYNNVLLGGSMYWFLHALILFNLILWASQFLAEWLRYVLVLAIIVCAPVIVPVVSEYTGLTFLGKYSIYVPVFLLGAYFKPMIIWFADRALSPGALVFTLLSFLTARDITSWVWPQIHDIRFDILQRCLSALLHLPLAITLAVYVSRLPIVSQFLQKIGQNTLGIYIGHQLVVTATFGFFILHRDQEISWDATSMLYRPTFWVISCIILGLGGGYLFGKLATVPVIGWTLHPPAINRLTSSETSQQLTEASYRLKQT
ncbi:Acyltransferase [Corynebacterium kutscheri]|uniref:Acyltransferase n=1 Tax=Corynebacterium kutscheri TaxID=35755 RepID=A0A0F6R0Z8_9CORY|nr:acyltransferase family protein [Corynebacterium kutscheri]AKE41580.1 putative membrane protein [Corynebacterium kutscheri]VEH08859.1 Acyltransferase [Corynebacterium kutscheri]VEH09904.1 Acyltransferase [Corynebacterium kutscheri]VEH79988.1 Acyltransferase [Corynebacterium kutscheri]